VALPKPHVGEALVTWRNVLRVHPAADLFPMMDDDALADVAEDIKANGLKQPVVIWSETKDSKEVFLLDGRNRLDAMEAAGLPVVREEWRGGGLHQMLAPFRRLYGAGSGFGLDGLSTQADPFEYAISANLHRRHLTGEQKRDLIARFLKAKPEQSNRQIAGQVKASKTTVGAVRHELETTGQIGQLEKTTGKDGKSRKKPNSKVNVTEELQANRERIEKLLKLPRTTPLTDARAARMLDVDHRTIRAARGEIRSKEVMAEVAGLGLAPAKPVSTAVEAAAPEMKPVMESADLETALAAFRALSESDKARFLEIVEHRPDGAR
jgi:hypothetical protein